MSKKAWLLSLLLVAGCTRTTPSPPPTTKEDAIAAEAPNTSAVAKSSPPHTALDASQPPEASAPAPIGARCEKDTDCGWDDPCAPSACGAKQEPEPGKKCGRVTPPGACRCAGSVCALIQPEKVRALQHVACQANTDCAFDPARGECVSGPPSASSSSGIACLCDTPNKQCVQMWQGEVSCKSSSDCSWRHLNGGGTSAAPAWFAPREKPVPVRPCKDSSVDSVCVDTKCVIRAWKC